jgi:hypothetical protein
MAKKVLEPSLLEIHGIFWPNHGFTILIKNDFSSYQYWKGNLQQTFLIQTAGQFKGYPKRHSATEIGFSITSCIYLLKEAKSR